MMTPDAMQGWSDFFVAEAGAAAALAGLLFVAISINLTRILEFRHLPTRAVEALLALLSVLVVATFALVPAQSSRAYAAEIGGTGLVIWAIQTLALTRTWKDAHPRAKSTARILNNQLPPLPFVIAGVLLIAGHPSGVYWVVPGTLLSFAAGIFGAWVLLIEIQR
jgi:modulator of FtsH protease